MPESGRARNRTTQNSVSLSCISIASCYIRILLAESNTFAYKFAYFAFRVPILSSHGLAIKVFKCGGRYALGFSQLSLKALENIENFFNVSHVSTYYSALFISRSGIAFVSSEMHCKLTVVELT